MQRRLSFLLIAAILIFSLVLIGVLIPPPSVTQTTPSSPQQTTPTVTPRQMNVTVIDMVGRKVVLKSSAERAIILQSYWAEVAYTLGAGDKIVGISKEVARSVYLPDYIRNKTVVGDVFTGVNLEIIMSLNPDIVITDTGYGKAEDIIKILEDHNISVLVMLPTSAEDQLRAISIIGTVFGKTDRANDLISFLKEKMEVVRGIASGIPEDKKPRVVMMARIEEGSATVYANTTWGRAIEEVGGVNIAYRELPNQAWPKVNIEKILQWDPDIIIVVAPDNSTLQQRLGILNEEPWVGLKAVKNGKVFGVLTGSREKGALLDWGPRMFVGYVELGKLINSDYFKEVDAQKIREELFRKFYPELRGG